MRLARLLCLAIALAACGPAGSAGATPSATPGRALSAAELKIRLLDELGRLAYCDPDFYPIVRVDEAEAALVRFPEINQDPQTLAAIVAHLGIAPETDPNLYTREAKLAIYREWKQLNAIRIGDGGAFQIRVYPTADTKSTVLVEGTIDAFGRISVVKRTPGGPPNCPICLARGTRIATPWGDVSVESLRPHDIVWTLGGAGARIAAPLLAVDSTPVPPAHQVVDLALSDGRRVRVSPGHPTADGRRVGDLAVGDALDGATIVGRDRVAYGGGATFDVLPAGATGAYWANGVLLGSTLR